MTSEEAIKLLNKWGVLLPSDADEALDMAIEALSVQVTGKLKNLCDSLLTYDEGERKEHKSKLDLISRQDAIMHFVKASKKYECGMFDLEELTHELWQIPSARPTGEWIKSNILPNGWHCSHCDSPVMTDDIKEMLFCPNCGAKMVNNTTEKQNDVIEKQNDVIEAVRCKDCKHGKIMNATEVECNLDGDRNAQWQVDDFCSYGELRGEDDE